MTNSAVAAQAVWAFTEHEHRDLARGINRIHELACGIGKRATPVVAADLLSILRWLETTLEPHIAWEEGWLYPEIDGRLGTPWATRAARFDHHQIREVSERLRADQHLLGNPAADSPAADRGSVDHSAETRCHLFSLEALLRAHIEREERFLIPLLADEPPATPGR
jgi:iron-sulfur cluster repair protein YtfE (RIC family)